MDFPALLALAIENVETRAPQESFAARLGVDQATISRWLTRRRRPRQETWPAIAALAGRTVDEVAQAIARTEWLKEPPLRDQLAQCQDELRAARLEVDDLRRRLARSPGSGGGRRRPGGQRSDPR